MTTEVTNFPAGIGIIQAWHMPDGWRARYADGYWAGPIVKYYSTKETARDAALATKTRRDKASIIKQLPEVKG